MKQVLQRLDNGAIELAEVPVPIASGPRVVVESRASVISAGTERMLLEFGRSNILKKAKSQPEKVRQVLDKMRTDGIGPTIDAVRSKLDVPIPLGYCNAGVVVDVGEPHSAFGVGDRVVTNGPHAEYIRAPFTLAAKIPSGVDFEAAAYTPIAAIGLQGLRLAAPTLGETVVVFGLGLIGLLTVQLLRANGCNVIGIDRDPERLTLAATLGAETVDGSVDDAVAGVLDKTGGCGADAVLLTLASASDEPVREAAAMSRKRGRLVLVGVTGLNLSREDFYEKELSFSVSCSYGPGRYDPEHEDEARDYPLPFVRWTEGRNFAAVLALMESGVVDPKALTTHRYSLETAQAAYDLIARGESSLGVVLEYPNKDGAIPEAASRTVVCVEPVAAPAIDGVGVIGAGNFAARTILPIVKTSGFRFRTIVSEGGTSGAILAKKLGFERTSTDVQSVLDDDQIGSVFVLTRHDSHAQLVVRAIRAGKHVFVEKPLALNQADLDEIETALSEKHRLLTVGYNRRFAPCTDEAKDLLRGRVGPLALVLTVNAGFIPQNHWTQNASIGGGRIVGEACHFIDLARYLVGNAIVSAEATSCSTSSGRPVEDVAHISLTFEDGSTAIVHYLANGARAYPKERIEAFFDGKTFVIDNWRSLRCYGIKGRRNWNWRRRMDKGHRSEIEAWRAAVCGGGAEPIPIPELFEVARWSLRVADMVRS